MRKGSVSRRRTLYMLGLIFAGEAIFTLPFHLARFFRPTVLEVFSLTPTELGAAQGIYGITAMLAYFPGGPLADRFPARKLLAVSLWVTAAGGLYLATFPGYAGALLIWGFFGISTILLFWAAMIRATREWGAHDEQGRAYGLLDSGRGLLAAALASVGVLLFGFAFPDGYGAATFEQKQSTLRLIIYLYTLVPAIAGVFVWFVIKDGQTEESKNEYREPRAEDARKRIVRVLRLPAVWLQAVIVICAYVSYKGFDNYALFAVQVYELDEVEAAHIVALGSWMRPVAALGCGMLGDRFHASRTIIVLFVVLLLSHLYFALTMPIPGAAWVMLGNTLVACIAIFGLRGLYFALFEEANVPRAVTGTAVGFVSVLGFTPDIFVNFVAGLMIDASPGVEGYQHFFLFLATFTLLGLIAALALARHVRPSGKPLSVTAAGGG